MDMHQHARKPTLHNDRWVCYLAEAQALCWKELCHLHDAAIMCKALCGCSCCVSRAAAQAAAAAAGMMPKWHKGQLQHRSLGPPHHALLMLALYSSCSELPHICAPQQVPLNLFAPYKPAQHRQGGRQKRFRAGSCCAIQKSWLHAVGYLPRVSMPCTSTLRKLSLLLSWSVVPPLSPLAAIAACAAVSCCCWTCYACISADSYAISDALGATNTLTLLALLSWPADSSTPLLSWPTATPSTCSTFNA